MKGMREVDPSGPGALMGGPWRAIWRRAASMSSCPRGARRRWRRGRRRRSGPPAGEACRAGGRHRRGGGRAHGRRRGGPPGLAGHRGCRRRHQIDPRGAVLEEASGDYGSRFASCVVRSVPLAKALEAAAGRLCGRRRRARPRRHRAHPRQGVGPVRNRRQPGVPRPYPQRQRQRSGRRGGALRRLHPVRAARSPRHRRRALLASARAAFIADAHLPVAGGRVLPAT